MMWWDNFWYCLFTFITFVNLMQNFHSWLEYTVINLHAVMISSLLNMVVNLYFFFGSGLWLTHQQGLGTMGNVQRLPSLGQTNIYLRESKETLSRCFIMEYGASAHSTLPPPSSRVQVHRQQWLFVVVFWEEIHRKQDFMVAKSALNFLSYSYLYFWARNYKFWTSYLLFICMCWGVNWII